MKIIYNGKQEKVKILGIGDFEKGKIYEVEEKQGDRLLKISGFKKIEKKGGKK